jgi:hypothetical protein
MRFGHVTLLYYARPGGEGKGAVWKGRCDCGNLKNFVARDLKAGRIKTCGNCEHHTALLRRSKKQPPRKGTYQFRMIMAREITLAQKAGCDFEMDYLELRRLLDRGHCHLCWAAGKLGVARMESSIGYTYENCIPVCMECRKLLCGLTTAEALAKWSERLTKVGFDITERVEINIGA